MRKIGLFGLLLVTMACAIGCSEKKNKEEETTLVNIKEDKTYEVSVEELVIKENGKEIYGKIYAPDEDGVFPTVILSHGYNGCNADFVNECKYFASNGIIAYAYDFSGGSTRSKSSGKSTEMTIFTEKEDLMTVLDYISGMEKVDSKHVYLFGGSQGGLVTALTAEECEEKICGMILYYPAFCIPDDWRKTYPTTEEIPETIDFWGLKLGRNFFVSIHDFYTFDNIGGFEKDILIIHGDKDNIVPLNYAEKAKEHYKNAELVVLPGEGHGFTPAGGEEAMNMVLDYMKTHLE